MRSDERSTKAWTGQLRFWGTFGVWICLFLSTIFENLKPQCFVLRFGEYYLPGNMQKSVSTKVPRSPGRPVRPLRGPGALVYHYLPAPFIQYPSRSIQVRPPTEYSALATNNWTQLAAEKPLEINHLFVSALRAETPQSAYVFGLIVY